MHLPVDDVLPELVAQLRERNSLVLVAEPGAGKTTRVPPAVLAHGLAGEGEILVAQPRRIAARMAAARVAGELGETLGGRVGYQVRFESVRGATTRLTYLTEGLLTRRLRDDPLLRGVSVVVLDELHERHLDTDVALALLRRLQRTQRPDLRIVAMSATIDPGPVAAFLDAGIIACAGRTFPVEVEYRDDDRELPGRVALALRALLEHGCDGGVLVFLPGAREIRDVAQACESLARSGGLDVAVLHGDLPAHAQDEATRPGPRPKLVLATNVAETSVTIDGIVTVIDSGLVRRPAHDPWSGIPTLTLAKISRASAIQRAGRAGRTRPGRCVRLYARHDFDRRPAFDVPEIERSDLAGAMLDLRACGLRGSDELAWLTAPPTAAIEAADGLLRRLGAIDHEGRATAMGRRLARMPAHPRLARVMVEAGDRGVGRLGAGVAALLSERPIQRGGYRRGSTRAAAADVLAELRDLEDRDGTLDRGAVQAVQRARKQFEAALGRDATRGNSEDDVCLALLAGFPDRVARCETRGEGRTRLVLAAGGEAELATHSVVAGATYVVALRIEQRDDQRHGGGQRVLVSSAAHIEPEWLLEIDHEGVTETVVARFDERSERVEATRETRYGALVLERSPCRTVPPEAAAMLRDAALARGPRAFVSDVEEVDLLLHRVAFVRTLRPEVTAITETDLRDSLAQLCEDARSFADLRRADLLAHLQARRAPSDFAMVERLAPRQVALASGRRLRVHYEADRPPWVASRLQDFFGCVTGPTVADGAVPLVLHLLAPNQRALQVTTDLSSFWSRHYPELRNALARRYPRHAWPDDPRRAAPPEPRSRK